MKIIMLFILIISMTILESRMKKFKQLKKLSVRNVANEECNEDEYLELFKSTIKEDANHPEIKAYFDAMVELNREKLLSLRKKKFLDITHEGKDLRQKLKKVYAAAVDTNKWDRPKAIMRSGGAKFRLKDAMEYVEALELFEKDFDFDPKNILELGVGQGRITEQVNAYYEKKNKDIKIDVLEPYPAQIKVLKKKKLSKVKNIYISKSEDFYCKEPRYDYIYGGMITNYIPDKFLPQFYVMLKSCLKDGGYIYFKDHFFPSHVGIEEEGQVFRPIEVLTTMMNLVGFTSIKVEESKLIDRKQKRAMIIIAK